MSAVRNWQLFAICVGVWSTTWYAITYQIGLSAPEVGVALRFCLAGVVVLGWCAARRLPLALGLRAHGLLALQGCFMYGVSYVCVYHAEKHLASGVVAVGFSASPLVTGLGAWALFGAGLKRRFLLGGVLGLCGVAMIFWPEVARARAGDGAALGALFTVSAVGLSAVGSLTASRNRNYQIPFWPALGWGMLYGALASATVAWFQGESFALPVAASWWMSLLYLSLAGSVLTFACFLTLQDRLGPGPTGTIGVMTPLLALALSILLENYRPSLLAMCGASLAIAGNVLMLKIDAKTKPVS
jgi:drug/metabolite transporter (DMT)-like permease